MDIDDGIRAAQVWEHIASDSDRDGPSAGLCLVIGPNIEGRRESPGSWVMMRLTAPEHPRHRGERLGQFLYMHRRERLAGRWVRRGMLAALAG